MRNSALPGVPRTHVLDQGNSEEQVATGVKQRSTRGLGQGPPIFTVRRALRVKRSGKKEKWLGPTFGEEADFIQAGTRSME